MRKSFLLILSICLLQISYGQSLGPVFDVFNKKVSFSAIPENVRYSYDSTSGFFGNQIVTMKRNLNSQGFLQSSTGTYLSISPFGNDTATTVSTSSWSKDTLITFNYITWKDGSSDTIKESVVYLNSVPQKFIIYSKPISGQFIKKNIIEYVYQGTKVTERRMFRRYPTNYNLYLATRTKFAYDLGGKLSVDSSIGYSTEGKAVDTTVGTYSYKNSRLELVRSRILNDTQKWFQKGVPVYNSSGQVEKVMVYQNYSMGDTTIPAQITKFSELGPLGIQGKAEFTSLKFSNPFQESFIMNSSGNYKFDIINLQGEVLLEGKTNSELNTSGLPNGIYLVKIQGEKGTYIGKILKN